MTSEVLDTLMLRLERRLRLETPEEEELLAMQDALEAAEMELLLYLNMDTLPDRLLSYVVKLAALFYQRDTQEQESGGEKSWSYSEGEQTQSVTRMTAADYQSAVDALLSGLARYRLVGVKGASNETA